MTIIRSRIHQYFTKELMLDLKKINTDVRVSDNNTKVKLIREALKNHDLAHHELGPGTNRYAILIDNYVFKIAMDKWGVLDNDNEFAMTEVLQPFVTTVYETNGLISVSEYVTLLSKDEFIEKKNDILKILNILSEGFLLGDVGYQGKNFANWGTRTDGSFVILDFAYIYSIIGTEIICVKDGNLLQYDETFTYLRCPHCRRKYETIEVRKQITNAHELNEIKMAKDTSYTVTQAITEFEEVEEIDEDEVDEELEEIKLIGKDVEEMGKQKSSEDEIQELNDIINLFDNIDYDALKKKEIPKVVEEEEEPEIPLIEIDESIMMRPREIPKEEPVVKKEDPFASIIDVMSSLYDNPATNEAPPESEPEEVPEIEQPPQSLNPLENMLLANGIDPEEEEEGNQFKPEFDYENGEGPLSDEEDLGISTGDVVVNDAHGEDGDNNEPIVIIAGKYEEEEEDPKEEIISEDPIEVKEEEEDQLPEPTYTEQLKKEETPSVEDEQASAVQEQIPEPKEEHPQLIGSEVKQVSDLWKEKEEPEEEGDDNPFANMSEAEMIELASTVDSQQEHSSNVVVPTMQEKIEDQESAEDIINEIPEIVGDNPSKKNGIVRLGSAKPEEDEDDDIMGAILNAQKHRPDEDEDEEERNKEHYENLAEAHLGKDPYHY